MLNRWQIIQSEGLLSQQEYIIPKNTIWIQSKIICKNPAKVDSIFCLLVELDFWQFSCFCVAEKKQLQKTKKWKWASIFF